MALQDYWDKTPIPEYLDFTELIGFVKDIIIVLRKTGRFMLISWANCK